MTHKIKLLLISISLMLVLICFFGCSDKTKEDVSVGEAFEWSFEYKGELSDITYEISDNTLAQIVYTSSPSDKRIVTRVRALSDGEATIVARNGDKKIATLKLTISREDASYVEDGVLIDNIAIENSCLELYRSDATVTYKITTKKLVDEISFMMFDSSDPYTPLFAYEDAKKVLDAGTYYELYTLTVDGATNGSVKYDSGKNGKAYSVSRTESGDSATWEIKWNLGNTAVKFVQIVALDKDTQTTHKALAHLDIRYPTFKSNGDFEEILKLWVKANVDGPLFFSLDTSDMTPEQARVHFEDRAVTEWADDDAFAIMGFPLSRSDLASSSASNMLALSQVNTKTLYDAIFDKSAIYRDNSISYLASHAMVTPLDDSNPKNQETLSFLKENVLAGDLSNRTYAFYYPISDEIRAIIAYQNGYEINKTLFPYAHGILEGGAYVLSTILEKDMTDFEKEREIYAWMVRNQQNQTNELFPGLTEAEKYPYIKTAYGFFNGYGGDCMGYSSTFFTLCNMAGVPCSTVDVLAVGGGASDSFTPNHRINLVRLDGEYYFVEAFWFYQKETGTEGDFRYVNMTTEKASTLYSWASDELFGPPVCDYSTYLVHENTFELLSEINK